MHCTLSCHFFESFLAASACRLLGNKHIQEEDPEVLGQMCAVLARAGAHLDPLGVDIAVEQDPLVLVRFIICHVAEGHADEALLPLARGRVAGNRTARCASPPAPNQARHITLMHDAAALQPAHHRHQ